MVSVSHIIFGEAHIFWHLYTTIKKQKVDARNSRQIFDMAAIQFDSVPELADTLREGV